MQLTKQKPVPWAEIRNQREPGELEKSIVELAATMQPGDGVPIDGKVITEPHFSGKVYALRGQRKLGLDYGVGKTKTHGFALVRYTEPRVGKTKRPKA